MELSLFIIPVLAFIFTFFITKQNIRFLRRIGLLVKDMNKKDTPLVPISGGIAVFSGIFISLMLFLFFQTFIKKSEIYHIDLFAAITVLAVISFIGFIDDVIIKKSKEESGGLKQWQKPLLTLLAAVPLMVVNAGTTKIFLPFFGGVDTGILYPLILVPLGVMGAANMVNLLAGFNGSEAGMGLVYTFSLGLYAYVSGSLAAAFLAFATFGALAAFILFNWCPAKILPGDSLTYLLGAVIACIAIIGNIEKAAIIASVPFFIEFFLKMRKKFHVDSYGYYQKGRVQSKYKKIYSIPHLLTRTGKFTEKQVSLFMILGELVFASLIWII